MAHGSETYYVRRDILDQPGLDEVARKRTFSTKPPLVERVKDSLRCSVPRVKRTIFECVPILYWLPRYSIRDNALGDVTSGISVGIMQLPLGLAYALLASLPPVYGLYSSLFPVLVYCIFGTSRHISMGTFAVTSIMVGTVTERMAPNSNFMVLNGTNGTGVVDTASRDALRVQIAASVALLGGLFQILLGVIKFGFSVTYLSEPLVRGYTTGAAVYVVISQLKFVFGVFPAQFSGPLAQPLLFGNICRLLPQTRLGAVVISLISLAVLIVVKELNTYYSKKLPIPIPVEIVVLIVGTLISHYGNLKSLYAVDVVGAIPSGFIPPRVPNVSLFSQVVGDAIAISIVSYAINISLVKIFATKHGYKADNNQELVALGLSNTVGGFFQCFSSTAALSRSLIQETTGGKTQVAGLVSCLIVLICILKVGALFEDLPKAILAAIVFVNLKGMFMQLFDIPLLWKTNKVDMMVWLVTLVCTFLLNLDIGLAVSIGFSVLTVIFRSQLPRYSVLGQVPGTELYVDVESFEEAREIPGITIFRCSSTVYYANAEMYLAALQQACHIDLGKVLTKKREIVQERIKEANMKQKEPSKLTGFLSKLGILKEKESDTDGQNGKISLDVRRDSVGIVSALNDKPDDGHTNFAFEHHPGQSESYQNVSVELSTIGGTEGNVGGYGVSIHSIILDFSTAGFVDTVTVNTLKNIIKDFREIDVDIYIASCQACVVGELERAGLFVVLPMSQVFASIHDAVLHCQKKKLDDPPVYDCVMDLAMTKL